MYPETAGRSLEQMDTFFENGHSWNVYKSSKQMKDQEIEDWMWMKKMRSAEDVEAESAVVKSLEASEEGEKGVLPGRLG